LNNRRDVCRAFGVFVCYVVVCLLITCVGYLQGGQSTGLQQLRARAEQGNAEAQYQLGSKYYAGAGVPKDYVQAYKWFNLAAAQGNVAAAKSRDNVANEMTREQIAEAQALSADQPHEPKNVDRTSDARGGSSTDVVAPPEGSKTVTAFKRSTGTNRADAEESVRKFALSDLKSQCPNLNSTMLDTDWMSLGPLIFPDYKLADYEMDASCDRQGNQWVCAVHAKGYCVDQNFTKRTEVVAKAAAEAEEARAALSARKAVNVVGLTGISPAKNIAEEKAMNYAKTGVELACQSLPPIFVSIGGLSNIHNFHLSDYTLDHMSCNEPSSKNEWWYCIAYVKGFCEVLDKETWLEHIPRTQSSLFSRSGPETRQPRSNGESPERSAIERIRRGNHLSLPAIQEDRAGAGTTASITFENATNYGIRVYVSGPVSRTLMLSPGARESLDLIQGQYELAAEVPGSSILPFLGQQLIQPNTSYREVFSLGTRF